MKVLSLLQPWASLVVAGRKTIETRSWTTAYRGRLLIHASKGRAGRETAAKPAIAALVPDFNALPFGAVIGEVILTDIVRLAAMPEDKLMLDRMILEENAFGSYDSARFGWIFTAAVMYDEPIPATGRMGLWEL